MSETVQFEQLLNEKAGVEEEAHDLDEEQRQLKLRARALVEKIIQELKKKNSEKHQTVNQLQSKIGELESQLNSLSIPKVVEKAAPPATISEEAVKKEEAIDTSAEETPNIVDEGNITVTEVVEEAMEEDLSAKQDKKKHKFF